MAYIAFQPIAFNAHNHHANRRQHFGHANAVYNRPAAQRQGNFAKLSPAQEHDLVRLLQFCCGQPLVEGARHARLHNINPINVAPKVAPRQNGFRGQIGTREDKRDYNRRHTVITGANGGRFHLLNSIDLRSEADIYRAIQGLPTKLAKQAGTQLKIIVGQGGFGKVRLAVAEDGTDLMIVKKMSPEDGQDEIRKFALLNKIPVQARQELMSLTDYAIVPGRDGAPKAYLFAPLMGAGDCAHPKDPTQLSLPKSYLWRLHLAELLIKPVNGLHNYGIYHRDLKPENYLKNKQGQVKLADPGLITQNTIPNNIAGTPAFMPPEAEYRGARADQADDFALGIMLYQLAGGYHPTSDYPAIDRYGKRQQSGDNKALLRNQAFIQACEAARHSNTNGKLSLKNLALHLMHPSPNKRLGTAEALRYVKRLKSHEIQRLMQKRRAAAQHPAQHQAAGNRVNYRQPIAVY